KLLNENKIRLLKGQSDVGYSYPETAKYNAVITKTHLIHNLEVTDNTIKESCIDKGKIHVNQGYTRCNLLPINNDNFITSDEGIYHTLVTNKLNVLYVDPQEILLPGFKNGFIGGACGVYQNRIFIIGSLINLSNGEQMASFVKEAGYQVIELCEGPLFDCGSLIFID
ncbi:MAG TPA: hypothetical protein QF480_05560, partial [Bacteroidales bacterium]|nr:hypothetical protein [Bacteroidales bacterium]